MSDKKTLTIYQPPTVDIEFTNKSFDPLPKPYRPTGLKRFTEPAPTIEDDAAWYKGFANLQYAKTTAVQASVGLARGMHVISRISDIFAHDDRLMAARYRNELRHEELVGLELDAKAAELERRKSQYLVGVTKDLREIDKVSGGTDDGRAKTKMGQRFSEALRSREEIDSYAEHAIEQVRASSMSPAEQKARIQYIRDEQRRMLMEEE